MICPNCGAEVTGGVPSCPSCGEPIPDPTSSPRVSATPRFAIPRVIHAGIWLRALAYILDSLLLGTVLGALVFWPILQMNHVGPTFRDFLEFYNSGSRQAIAFDLLLQLASWLYFASFESSAWQATPGKKVLNLKVTDLAGGRIRFVRASARHFGKFISGLILFIGFAMIAFTEKRQALHDMLAGCLVVRRT